MKSAIDKYSRRVFLLRFAAVTVAGSAAAQQRGPDGRYKPQLRKRTREEVHYQDGPHLGRTCSRCVLYQGNGTCVILEGPVSPNGWCNQWVPNTMG